MVIVHAIVYWLKSEDFGCSCVCVGTDIVNADFSSSVLKTLVARAMGK